MSDAHEAGRCMIDAAERFRSTLTREQRDRASLPFNDHATRSDWAYFPRRLKGIQLTDLNHRQVKAAMVLLESGLSFEAFARASTIMSIENVLDSLEGRRLTAVRDPAMYCVCLWVDTRNFGEQIRGWSFEGHHVSVNYLFERDGSVIASSPLFLGSNPARVRHGDYDVLRPLGDAEDRARELLQSLTPEQRARAIVNDEAPVDMVLANLPVVASSEHAIELPILVQAAGRGGRATIEALRFSPDAPLGVSADSFTAGQRELLAGLVGLYTSRYPSGAAWTDMGSLDGMHFAWAGSPDEFGPHYYRLQSPNLVVEYDNIQNDANHVHTVARHPRNDFGAAALALHHVNGHLQ